MGPKFSELEVVRLKEDANPLMAGAEGTVVFVHEAGAAYEVEFTDEQGSTLAVLTLPETALAATGRVDHGPLMATLSFKGDVNALLAAALGGKRNERELRETIRKAARLFERAKAEDLSHHMERSTVLAETWGAIREWLALPAVQSALMLEEADKA